METSKEKRIAELERMIEHEYSEEYRYVEMFRPLIKEVDELSKSFIGTILNSGRIKRLNKEMQGYADMANDHQRRKNKLKEELSKLEKSEE